MLQGNTEIPEEDVQEAMVFFEGFSPDLIAASIQEYTPGIAAALMTRWEPAWAGTVRQHIDLDGWVHIVDGSPDTELSIQWLSADVALPLAKQVVDRIGRLDKSRGRGMARALQLMKGLRSGNSLIHYFNEKIADDPSSLLFALILVGTSPTTILPNAMNAAIPTPSSTMHTSSSNQVPPPRRIPSTSLATLNTNPIDSSSPRDGPKTTLTTIPAMKAPPTKLPDPSALPGEIHTATVEAAALHTNSEQLLPTEHPPLAVNASSTPATLLGISNPKSEPPLTASLLSVAAKPAFPVRSTLDPSGSDDGKRPSDPPVLPTRGQDHRTVQKKSDPAAPFSGSFFSGTPIPQGLGVNLGGRSPTKPLAMPTSTSPAPPQGTLASGIVSPQAVPAQPTPAVPVQRVAERCSSPQPIPPTQHDGAVAPDVFHAENKTKHTDIPNPNSRSWPPRSPTPMEEDLEESGLDSDDEYLPGASSQESPLADDDERDSEQEDVDFSEGEDGREEDGDESDGDSGENSDKPETGRTTKRDRRPKEIEIPTKWTWDKRENDRRVREWQLEKEIDSNPTALHPVRTKWMYEARLGDLTEEDYEDILRAEHKDLMKVPPACRSVVGQMYLRRAKGDWEFRVVLTCLTWRYTKVKIKKEEAAAEEDKHAVRAYTTEMTKILNDGIASLFERFPDMAPEHERRQIEKKLGADGVAAYVQTLRSKVTSDAGRMFSAHQANGGTLGLLESKSAKSAALSIFDILGKKRKDVAFHLWGGSSSGGRDECDKRIKEKLDRWKKGNPSKTSREISDKALKVVCDVRKDLFEDQPVKVRAAWEERAKTLHLPETDEERQCLVDAILPALFRLFTQLSKHTSLHFVLLASGQGTSNVPVLVHDFAESTDEQLSFFDESAALAQRLRADYLKYAIGRHNTGQEEVVEGLPVMHTPDDTPVDAQSNSKAAQAKQSTNRRTPIKPFEPNLSVVKSRSQRVTYLSKWFMDAGERIVGYKISWDSFCKNVRKYVDTERMPIDPLVEGKKLEIQRPTAMEDLRFDAWWNFMIASYDGTLPEANRFMFHVEALHDDIPTPPTPEEASVHQAAINAAKTVPMKKSTASGGSKKGRKTTKQTPRSDAARFLDVPGITEDEDEALLVTAFDKQGKPGLKQRPKKVRWVESPEPVDEDSERQAETTVGGEQPGESLSSESAMDLFEENAATASGQAAHFARVSLSEPVVQAKPRPRPRGELSPAVEHLSHPSFPGNNDMILTRWQQELAKLTSWGRKMGVGPRPGMVLRFKGTIKRDWVSLLPTGLDAVFCIVQMWAARQAHESSLTPISIPPMAGLTAIDPSHPIALTIHRLLDHHKTLPVVKLSNMQFGASPGANDAFLDFIEGTLTALVRRALQSEQVLLDGAIDVMQVLRWATFIRGTGFMRDSSTVSDQTSRTGVLADRLNIFLASLSFVRYHHVVLGGVVGAFAEDQSIDGDQKVMWVLMKDTWNIAVRSMARAIVQRRSDLFDRQRLPSLLPEALDRMAQTSISLRPWWIHGELGLPSTVAFTTKRTVASSDLYDTLPALDWSSLSLLERSQYLLLVLLAGVQIHKGRLPTEIPPVGVPRGPSNLNSQRSIEKMTLYLCDLKMHIVASTETGDFDPSLEDRLILPNVLQAIQRWESESSSPGVIQITVDEEDILKAKQSPSETKLTDAVDRKRSPPTEGVVNDRESLHRPIAIPNDAPSESRSGPASHPQDQSSPAVKNSQPLPQDATSTSSSALETSM
ncbi:hypothetical protein FRC01_004160 [Tulasnella sp. 417]|nr:hypothetical protein FRC01_004160 [Tulasnella sp. 417]